jgi:hypothetical protein
LLSARFRKWDELTGRLNLAPQGRVIRLRKFKFNLIGSAPPLGGVSKMRIAKIVRSVPFAKVERGSVVRFFVDGKRTGMKVYSAQGKNENEGMLFLTDHPSYRLGCVAFPAETASPPWNPDLMLEFCDAVLLIKDFTHISAATDTHAPKLKSLTLHLDGKIMFLSKTSEIPPQYVDMESGEIFAPTYQGPWPSLVVSDWAILTEKANETLVEFTERAAS